MKKLFFIFFCLNLMISVFGQDYNLENGIILDNNNRRHSTSTTFNSETNINSAWNWGSVIRYSNDENNAANLGRFVEIEYEMGFEFEGTLIRQGSMRVIFSNLSEINVSETSRISVGTLIGKTKRGGNNQLVTFILSEEDELFLRMWTNNRKERIGDFWYWDASFLYR